MSYAPTSAAGLGDGVLAPLEARRVDTAKVPTFWVPADSMAAAGLVFHVGRATEPMAMRGMTRIIEHVVGMSVGYVPKAPRHSYASETTAFSYRGEASEVAAFLYAVSWALSSLPLDLVDAARDIVQQEDESRVPGAKDEVLRLRHGFTGPGAGGLPDFGVRKSGHRQVLAWTTANFQRSNAALWLAGPRLDDLNLRLITGVRVSYTHKLRDIPTPGAGHCDPGEVALSFLMRAGHASLAGVRIAEARARHQLIRERGLSNSVVFEVNAMPDDQIEVVATASSLPNREDEVARVLLAVIDDVVTSPPTEADVAYYRDQVSARIVHPDNAPSLAQASAVGYLTGRPVRSSYEALEELDQLTIESITAALADACQTRLLVAPEYCSVLSEQFKFVGDWQGDAIMGSVVRPSKAGHKQFGNRELRIGPKGLTLREGNHTTTLRFSECGVMLVHSQDNERELISEAGFHMLISAADWQAGDKLVASIDEEIAAEKRIVLDAAQIGSSAGIDRRLRARSALKG